MAQTKNRYAALEHLMTMALIADGILFLLYLIFAACGVIWLKVILAICVFLISGAALALLYMTKELLRRRSLWMTTGAAAALACLLFSLILNFP